MTRRVLGGTLRQIRRRDPITADYLNELAALADRNSRKLDDISTEAPIGEDGESGTGTEVWNELSQFTITETVRIEDDTDPTIYVDVRRVLLITLESEDSGALQIWSLDPAGRP
jgi:hypothetical protein